jgi:GNAT superfamily N-acetyltransferase
MLNYVRADRGDAAEVAAAAENALEAFHHRKVFTYLDLDLEWNRNTHLVMLHRRDPDRRLDTSHVRPVSFDEIAPLRMYDYDDRVLGEQLNEAQRRVGRAIDVEWLAAFDGDELAAWCHIRSREGIAQIEDVNTMPALRGRGHGRAVVQQALDEAHATHELVYLEALEDDWPRHLSSKLGFDEIDRCHHHVRPAHPLTRLRIRTDDLELRVGTAAEWRALGEVAEPLPRSRDDWSTQLVVFRDGRPIGWVRLAAAGPGGVVTHSSLGEGEALSAIRSFALDVLKMRTVDGERPPSPIEIDVEGFDPSWLDAR